MQRRGDRDQILGAAPRRVGQRQPLLVPLRVRSDTWIAMSDAPYAKSIGLIMTSGTPFSPASAVARFSLWRSNAPELGAQAPVA